MRRNTSLKTFLMSIFVIIFINVLTISGLAQNKAGSEKIIDDPKHYLSKEEIEKIEKEAKKLPEYYRIIILENVNGSPEEAARTFFRVRQYPQDAILILALAEKKEIFIVTGEAAEKKGLNKEFFNQEINQYFIPEMKERSATNAIIELMKGISNDISKQLISNYQKDTPKIPTQHKEEKIAESNSIMYKPSFWIISLIVILVTLLILVKKNAKNIK